MPAAPKPIFKKKKKNWGFKRSKSCKADDTFSDYIRLRDGKCVRCGRLPAARKSDGFLVVGLQCSHYFGRRKESTRFDPQNCDALCGICHSIWEATDREDYRDFKIKQLGQQGFDLLRLKSNQRCKKDRAASLLYAQSLLSELERKSS